MPEAVAVGHRLTTFEIVLHESGHPRYFLVLTRISHMLNAEKDIY